MSMAEVNEQPVTSSDVNGAHVNGEEPSQAQDQPAASQETQATEVVEPPLSEFEATLVHLRIDKHDIASWSKLIDLAEGPGGDLEKIKTAYEALLEVYPNVDTAQINYLNHFLTASSFREAEALFSRFLRPSPSVALWKFYLVYIRRKNTDPSTRDVVKKAYEFALAHVGQDKDSGEMWKDYIDFLKVGETRTTWEEQQKMDSVRRVYHRAVQIPLENLETLWRELDQFENSLNKITAKKFLGDLSPSYMEARTKLRELRKYLTDCYPPPVPSTIPSSRPSLNLPRVPIFDQADKQLQRAWRQYLTWEQDNPLLIEEKTALNGRIQHAFRKAVIKMRFFPEFWYQAYQWLTSIGKQEDALVMLKSGLEAVPTSPLLCYAYAEAMEVAKNFTEVRATYDKVIEAMHPVLNELKASIDQAEEPTTAPSTAHGDPAPLSAQSTLEIQPNLEKERQQRELNERRAELTNIWINYIRFARRAEGLGPSRVLFTKSRKDEWITWEAYEAAAMMEYHHLDAKDVATRIFEKGMEVFGDQLEFIMSYLNFLIQINDKNNARALFERVVGNFEPKIARPLWDRWANYEFHHGGDLPAAQKLQQRFSEVYPNEPSLKFFARRHEYRTDAIASRDLGYGTSSKSNNSSNSQQSLRDNSWSTIGNSSSQQHSSQERSQILSRAPPPRAPSPDRKRREREGSARPEPPPPKRARPASPRREERERWEGRRSSGWEREGSPAPRRGDRDDDRDRNVVPMSVSWFMSQLPAPHSFDGPVYRTDDLLGLFRTAVIPGSTSGSHGPPPRVRSPPPAHRGGGGGRPPPDYSPYQGPGGNRGGRRY